MNCEKVTIVKEGPFGFNGKKCCQKEGVIKASDGRLLCLRHYNKWLKKISKNWRGHERVAYKWKLDSICFWRLLWKE